MGGRTQISRVLRIPSTLDRLIGVANWYLVLDGSDAALKSDLGHEIDCT